MDGTYTIVRKPFQVLFTIHVVLKKGDSSKQVPVVFALMSHCTIEAYTALFTSINRIFEREKWGPPKVIRAILDFETATWRALRSVYSEIDLVGCFFHWCQAVRRRMDQEGLAKSTTSTEERRICRLLLALPLLPAQFIRRSFENIKQQATGPLQAVCAYMDHQWINSSVHPPEAWSVFMLAIRTNNPTEGWHNGFQVGTLLIDHKFSRLL
jgi:hypothetical protein